MLSRFARTTAGAAARAMPRAAAVVTRAAQPLASTSATAMRVPALRAAASTYPTLTGTFGENSFNARAMKQYLSKDVFARVTDCINNRTPISPDLANHFAKGLQQWAEDRGATHFAHWFQPMTNTFALKHDSLIKRDGDHVITELTGKMLVKGEPDGSSFPNGGLRATHEARGYTVWDPSAPCFVADHGTGSTLCIPSVFFTWEGNALDEKTPLLRSVEALQQQGLRMLKAMGETKHKSVHADSGVEQEFFLIDQDYYLRRPDIMQTGRTLIGANPPKGQALDDQYFGAFSDRFLQAMNAAEVAMWKLGIPQTTRHREVAPGQYEMAPVFAPVTVAGEYNLLQMDTLARKCEEHGVSVLFHEKPFANLNGSGKHNNWSVGTDLIPTVFAPGSSPATNTIFLTFLAATVRAVHLHADVLRTVVSGAGNDHRLGGHEAPPAIVSCFLGAEVTAAINEFMGEALLPEPSAVGNGDLGCPGLPEFAVDGTDRNRTSTFAFTGNKFEYRAVGSSQNPTRSNTYLNTLVADSLDAMAADLEARVGDRKLSRAELKDEVTAMLRDTFRAHAAAIFDGDGYSEEWQTEAARRGLLNLRTTADALEAFDSDKNASMFARHGVFNGREFESRVNVSNEEYVTKVTNEANSFLALAKTAVLPAGLDMQTKVSGAIIAAESAGASVGDATRGHFQAVNAAVEGLAAAINNVEAVAAAVADQDNETRYCCDTLLPALAAARVHADAIEQLAEAESWPMPTYHEMLFHQS